MNAIALRAGVSKANIFHHFTSKNALYLAVLDAACKETRERIDVLQNTEGSFIEHLSHFCQEHLQSILQREHISRLILRDLLEEGETRGQELAEQVFGRNFAKFVEMIRLGQSRRELRSDIDPAALAVLLIAANVYSGTYRVAALGRCGFCRATATLQQQDYASIAARYIAQCLEQITRIHNRKTRSCAPPES